MSSCTRSVRESLQIRSQDKELTPRSKELLVESLSGSLQRWKKKTFVVTSPLDSLDKILSVSSKYVVGSDNRREDNENLCVGRITCTLLFQGSTTAAHTTFWRSQWVWTRWKTATNIVRVQRHSQRLEQRLEWVLLLQCSMIWNRTVIDIFALSSWGIQSRMETRRWARVRGEYNWIDELQKTLKRVKLWWQASDDKRTTILNR